MTAMHEYRNGSVFQEDSSNPHASSEIYYGAQKARRGRALSNAGVAGYSRRRPVEASPEILSRVRRLSEDASSFSAPTRFLVDVEETMRIVLAQEDTTGNFQISAEDSGPKMIALGTDRSNAHNKVQIRGTYMMSNLLQELAIAQDHGHKTIVLDEARLKEDPVDRLSRLIRTSYWDALTRRMDEKGIARICNDPKNRSTDRANFIYVPHGEDEIAQYYQEILVHADSRADKNPNLKVKVEILPEDCTNPEFVKSLNDKPGALALAMKRVVNPETKKVQLEPLPFVVPGDRFNEKYGWDSYFIALGLLIDGKIDLAVSIVEHCIFEIKHYGKVLNGTRTYYLGRGHPPFLTDLAIQTYQYLDPFKQKENKQWLKRAIAAAIKEYHTYWMVPDHLDPVSGLTRYRPKALGFPPETEASHFNHIVQPYAEKMGLSIEDYMTQYDEGKISEPELDDYILHDRAVRESGHDTSYRLDKKAADLATVDLNSLLYKYEIDIANCISELFDDSLEIEEEFDLSTWPITPEAFAESAPSRIKSTAQPMTSKEWYERAAKRQESMDRLCWNEGVGMYFDYDTKARKLTRYESVTTLWPLWAGCASADQAARLVRDALPKFTAPGGLVSGTEQSRGIISLDRPNRQWDYPYGWSPHQIIAWVGLERYDYGDEAARLAYRWLFMMTLSFVDFSGIVPEKFDAVEVSHLVDAEYGNQGTMFQCVNREGFGWTNAAYQVGLQYMTAGMRRALAACVPPWELYNLPAPDFPGARKRRQEREAREAEAAAKGLGGEIKRTFHRDHRTLEQAISQLSLDRSHF